MKYNHEIETIRWLNASEERDPVWWEKAWSLVPAAIDDPADDVSWDDLLDLDEQAEQEMNYSQPSATACSISSRSIREICSSRRGSISLCPVTQQVFDSILTISPFLRTRRRTVFIIPRFPRGNKKSEKSCSMGISSSRSKKQTNSARLRRS